MQAGTFCLLNIRHNSINRSISVVSILSAIIQSPRRYENSTIILVLHFRLTAKRNRTIISQHKEEETGTALNSTI